MNLLTGCTCKYQEVSFHFLANYVCWWSHKTTFDKINDLQIIYGYSSSENIFDYCAHCLVQQMNNLIIVSRQSIPSTEQNVEASLHHSSWGIFRTKMYKSFSGIQRHSMHNRKACCVFVRRNLLNFNVFFMHFLCASLYPTQFNNYLH